MEASSRDKPRTLLRMTQGVAFALLAAFALHAGFGIGGHRIDWVFNDWVYNGLVLLSAVSCLVRAARVREQRAAWLVLGAGLVCWTAAEIYSTVVLGSMDDPPYPSLADGLSLAFYPASYVALFMLARGRMREARASLWLDGLVASLAVCAVAEMAVFHTVAKSALGHEGPWQVATDLAYPVGDILMLALVASVFALSAWRPGRVWAMIGLGLVLAGIADSAFAYQAAVGSYDIGSALDALWPAATLMIGFAAWERGAGAMREIRLDGWRVFVLPTAFALPGLGVLVWDHYHRVDAAAVVLAALTLVAVVARTAWTFGENMRMLRLSRHEALTDALTGLGNRRRLMLDLHDRLDGLDRDRPRALALFDLDGFKNYNDNFGHPAGDALLSRLGRNLAAAVAPHGEAYRLGGDEFCALVSVGDASADDVVVAATSALSERGKGFEVTASHGLVSLPGEASNPSAAMQIADQRLYRDKGARQAAAVSDQTRDVLMQVLQERQPELHEHLHEVAELSLAVARRMGLHAEALDEIARAAELHDVGKMAVPDEILDKPAALDSGEMEFIRQHTIVGERILAAAPALVPVAKIVRSSHESWDGSGYPDGLAGEAIPLASRIISVCDAYHAMTSERPYQPPVAPADALAELRRCAGRNFDPAVVETVCREIEDRQDGTTMLHLEVAPDFGIGMVGDQAGVE